VGQEISELGNDTFATEKGLDLARVDAVLCDEWGWCDTERLEIVFQKNLPQGAPAAGGLASGAAASRTPRGASPPQPRAGPGAPATAWDGSHARNDGQAFRSLSAQPPPAVAAPGGLPVRPLEHAVGALDPRGPGLAVRLVAEPSVCPLGRTITTSASA
jgi:hypothetical protein